MARSDYADVDSVRNSGVLLRKQARSILSQPMFRIDMRPTLTEYQLGFFDMPSCQLGGTIAQSLSVPESGSAPGEDSSTDSNICSMFLASLNMPDVICVKAVSVET